MGYVITIKRYSADEPHNVLVNRRAVATLDEAREMFAPVEPSERSWALLAEQGGTITLPDGTVIKVERETEG